jgi:hypothetical protein
MLIVEIFLRNLPISHAFSQNFENIIKIKKIKKIMIYINKSDFFDFFEKITIFSNPGVMCDFMGYKCPIIRARRAFGAYNTMLGIDSFDTMARGEEGKARTHCVSRIAYWNGGMEMELILRWEDGKMGWMRNENYRSRV